MTCREKLAIEYPGDISEEHVGGCALCPNVYGYLDAPKYCSCGLDEDECTRCWDREIPESPSINAYEGGKKFHEGLMQGLAKPEGTAVMNNPDKPTVLDSGHRREFATGAVRDMQEGKGRCDLMPLDVVVMHMGDTCLAGIYDFELTGDIRHLRDALRSFSDRYGIFEDDYKKKAAAMYLDVSHQFEDGAKKYGEHNWQKGIPVTCYIDSAVRHYLKLMAGWTDEPHDRAFVWNLMCCMWTCEHMPELNTYADDEKEN